MKIAFVNNMNNNFFSMVRYFRDKGIDAHLFIFDELSPGFFPQTDTFDDVSKMDFIHVVGQISLKDFLLPFSPKVNRALKKLKNELADFDVVFACGMLAFFERAGGFKIDVMLPYGSDIFQLPNLESCSKKKYFPYLQLSRYISRFQRQAIEKVRVFVCFASNNLDKLQAFKNLNRSWINWHMPMVYPVSCPIEHTDYWRFLKDHDFVLFSHMRHTWKTGTDYNGNERIIKGYAKFIKEASHYKKPIFVMFEYSHNVLDSKMLVQELGIEDYVKWVPRMDRKNIYAGLLSSSIVAGVINEEVVSYGGVVYEAFSCGKPVIGNGIIKGSNAKHGMPLVQAITDEDVFHVLVDFQKDPEKYKQIGLDSKVWFDKNVGEGLVDQFIELSHQLCKEKYAKLEDQVFSHLVYDKKNI